MQTQALAARTATHMHMRTALREQRMHTPVCTNGTKHKTMRTAQSLEKILGDMLTAAFNGQDMPNPFDGLKVDIKLAFFRADCINKSKIPGVNAQAPAEGFVRWDLAWRFHSGSQPDPQTPGGGTGFPTQTPGGGTGFPTGTSNGQGGQGGTGSWTQNGGSSNAQGGTGSWMQNGGSSNGQGGTGSWTQNGGSNGQGASWQTGQGQTNSAGAQCNGLLPPYCPSGRLCLHANGVPCIVVGVVTGDCKCN